MPRKWSKWLRRSVRRSRRSPDPSDQLDRVVFDHRVGEELLAHRGEVQARVGRLGIAQLDVEHLALADTLDGVEAEALERAGDGLALRVKHTGFEGDGNSGSHKSLLLDEAWSGRQRVVGFHKNAETLRHLAVGVDETAEIFAEAVLVELVPGLDVPQPAIIGRNLVGEHDAHRVALVKAAALDLEVDELDADAHEQAGEEVVDPDGKAHDVVELGGRGPAERGDVLFRDHRVVERVVLVVELDDRTRQLRAGFEPEALHQRAGGDVAHHHLERDDLDFLDQLLAHVDTADEMRRDAELVELAENVFGDAVVQDALAVDDVVLGAVAGGGVVFEILNKSARLRTLVKVFRLALVNLPPAVHGSILAAMVGRLVRSCARTGRKSKLFRGELPVGTNVRGAGTAYSNCFDSDVAITDR